jgi:DNA gyrase subunit A
VVKGVDLLTVSEQGLGKKTPIDSYPKQKRHGSGVLTAKVTGKTGPLVAAVAMNEETSELLFGSSTGQVIKIEAEGVPSLSRATQGVRLMRMADGDTLATVTAL